MQTLVTEFSKSDADYLSFQLAGNKPSILTHFGFWTEAVRLVALEKSTETDFRKVVPTNMLPITFMVTPICSIFGLLRLILWSFRARDIRMTLDTPEDFEIQQEIFATISKENPNFGIPEIISWLDQHPEILELMKKEILKNQK